MGVNWIELNTLPPLAYNHALMLLPLFPVLYHPSLALLSCLCFASLTVFALLQHLQYLCLCVCLCVIVHSLLLNSLCIVACMLTVRCYYSISHSLFMYVYVCLCMCVYVQLCN